MARGQDTRNHPNRRVGRSDLPRLSRALGGMLNDAVDSHQIDYEDDPEEGEEDLAMQHSMINYIPNAYNEGVSEMDAQGALNTYRQNRAKGRDQEFYQEDIRDAYRMRGNY